MKSIWYSIFKRKVYKKAQLNRLRENYRDKMINDVKSYCNKWDDMPISWLIEPCSEMLGVPKGKHISKDYIYSIILNQPIKRIPLEYVINRMNKDDIKRIN
jgi:hypothetical protein